MNRRISKAQAAVMSYWSSNCEGAGINLDALPHGLHLQARVTWHLDQHRARVARTERDHWYEGTPASHAVTRCNPLHTQWLTGTMTPWEYQHLVRRGRKPTGLETPSHNCWSCLDRAEHDFLYRESAPCGAD